MILTTLFLLIGFAISLPFAIVTGNAFIEVVSITFFVTLYHFAMRLAVGSIVNLIMKNNANYKNAWFREKRFEKKLYKLLRVQKWKKYIPTYSPDAFDVSNKTIKEIIGATCQAEIVHELIMVLSLLPIALIPFLGAAPAFVVTSLLSMMIDCVFVILQRYNRPKLTRVMERYHKLPHSSISTL